MRLSSLVIATALLASACTPANDEGAEDSLEEAYNEGYEAGIEEAEAEAEEEISELQEALDEASERMAELIDEQTAAPDEDTDPEDADIIARVDQVFEPAESEARINEANQFNDPPKEGHRFWMLWSP